jgi:putative Holliday junction resolvase
VIKPANGIRVSIDVGTVRIGIAKSDQDQIMAVPVATISATPGAKNEIAKLINETHAELVYVGKPIGLNSASTASTQMAIAFARELEHLINVPIHLLDERLTTVSAQAQLHSVGKNSKQGRNVIDQIAAVLLLDHAMAIEKSTEMLAGQNIIEIQLDN